MFKIRYECSGLFGLNGHMDDVRFGLNGHVDDVIEILSPNKTQELHTKSRGSQIANIAYIANIANTATTIIPKITFTSSTCPFRPNTIRMSSQTE
jgi:hypothetical protein